MKNGAISDCPLQITPLFTVYRLQRRWTNVMFTDTAEPLTA